MNQKIQGEGNALTPLWLKRTLRQTKRCSFVALPPLPCNNRQPVFQDDFQYFRKKLSSPLSKSMMFCQMIRASPGTTSQHRWHDPSPYHQISVDFRCSIVQFLVGAKSAIPDEKAVGFWQEAIFGRVCFPEVPSFPRPTLVRDGRLANNQQSRERGFQEDSSIQSNLTSSKAESSQIKVTNKHIGTDR